jgi:ATP-dependent Lon protease
VAQKNASDDDPTPSRCTTSAPSANVLQLLKLPDGTVKVLVEGLARAEVEEYTDRDEFFRSRAIMPVTDEDGEETEALARTAVTQFESYVKLNKKVRRRSSPRSPRSTTFQAGRHDCFAPGHQDSEKQDCWRRPPSRPAGEGLGLMEGEISVLQVEKRIRSRVKRQMEKTQREYYLNEQMKAIQKELGDGDGRDEMARTGRAHPQDQADQGSPRKGQRRIQEAEADEPDVCRGNGRAQLSRLAAVDCPWGKKSRVKNDLPHAEKVLEADHFGLEKVKERIVEYLAVQARANKLRGPILCLVGPPGVGKTSLASPLPRRPGANTCACRWAVCVTRPKSAVTGAPTSARCPARSSSR